MSKIQVDDIYSRTGNPPTFLTGAEVSAGSFVVSPTGVSIVGIASGQLIGDGSLLTGLSSAKKLVGLTIVQIL